MKPIRHRTLILAPLAILGAILALVASNVFAAVDFVKETHFRCYIVSQQTPAAPQTVILDDQFMPPTTVSIDEPLEFCPPTSKDGATIEEPAEHLTMYAAPFPLPQTLSVRTQDQFGLRTLTVTAARVLLVPTEKNDLGEPTKLNHYWCYAANGPKVNRTVTLADQFGSNTVRVAEPEYFCNPVEKTHAGTTYRIEEPDVHLTCYDIKGPQKTKAQQFRVQNQIESDTFIVTSWDILCVPSAKLGSGPA